MRRLRGDRSERGSALVESALVLPLFLMVTFGIVQFGMVAHANNSLSALAREGARWAMVRGAAHTTPANATTVANFIRGKAKGLDPARLTITTTWTPDNRPGSTVRVTLQYTLDLMIPLISTDSIQLQATTRAVVVR